MSKFILAAVFALMSLGVAQAKNFAVPEKNPIATLSIPDKWKTEEIEYGYSAKSPDGDVFFSIESAEGKRVQKLSEDNDAWLKEQKIKTKGEPKIQDISLSGLKAKLYTYDAKDEDGATIVEFVIIPDGKGRVILLTLWASEAERQANAADIQAIESSVKPIN